MLGILPIDAVIGVALYWLAIGIAGIFMQSQPRLITKILFPAGAVGALILSLSALGALGGPANIALSPLGLPDLPFHLRLDALSAFFVFLLGAATLGISLFSTDYFRSIPESNLGLLCLEYHVFLASMVFVFLADDAYLFMVAWETMAVSSYFLVTTNHEQPDIRRAGFLYLLIAHIGAISILMCFGVMQSGHGDYTFATMRGEHLTSFWASRSVMWV